jgi:hypothetical protein
MTALESLGCGLFYHSATEAEELVAVELPSVEAEELVAVVAVLSG